MRKNPAMISRLEALNPETPDYKNSTLTSPLLCLLKVISNRKLNVMEGLWEDKLELCTKEMVETASKSSKQHLF